MNTRNQGCWRTISLALACALAGCGSTDAIQSNKALPLSELSSKDAADKAEGVSGMLSKLGQKALEATGLKKPEKLEAPDLPPGVLPARHITWTISGSTSMNVNAQGSSAALVVRLYRLRNVDAFLQLPSDQFGDTTTEKEALAEDLISARDLQVLPGQQLTHTDKVPREVSYVGIVALFREPAPQRWRYAFQASDAERLGLNLGAHACALSVHTGKPVGIPSSLARSAAITCP